MVHESLVGGDDNVSELSGWEDATDEVLELGNGEIESWGDDSALVKSSVEVDNDLSRSGVIDDLEVVDVSVNLHLSEELDNNL